MLSCKNVMNDSEASCVDDVVQDLESQQVYTYCGNCQGVRNLIDKYNDLKRSYDTCLKMNQLLVEKLASADDRSKFDVDPPWRTFHSLGDWDEEKERRDYQRFVAQISGLNADVSRPVETTIGSSSSDSFRDIPR